MFPSKPFSDDRHWLHISLRIFLFITSLAVIGSIAWTIAAHGGHSDPDVGGAINVLLLAGSAFTCLWVSIVLALRILFTTRITIHPGIYVAFDLIALLLLAITAGLTFVFSSPFERMSKYNSESHNTLLRVEYFSCIMSFVDCAVLLALFVWACCVTHIYRKERITKNTSHA